MKMQRAFFFFIFSFFFSTSTIAQPSALEQFKSIKQTPEIVAFFGGLFNHLGIVFTDSDETLTLHHTGEKILLSEGMDSAKVDFILPLKKQDVLNMIAHAEDGKINDDEATRIASVFFTPFTRATMQNQVLSENKKRKFAGIEDIMHIYLLFPDGSVAAEHTLIYVSDQWIVLDDIRGEADRTFKMEHGPALTYQRKVFAAIEKDTRRGWLNFVKWYKDWREDYSTTP